MSMLHIGIIVGLVVVVAVASEVLNIYMVFSKPAYKDLQDQILRLQDKIDKLKSGNVSRKQAKSADQVDKMEAQMKQLTQAMTGLTLRGTLITGFTSVFMFWFLSRVFSERTMLVLPFEPFSFIRGITHRGALGENSYDCGYLFVYILASTALKPIISKIMGTEQPKTPSPFSGLLQQ